MIKVSLATLALAGGCLLASPSDSLFAQTSITLQPGQSTTIKPGQDVTVMCTNAGTASDIRVEFYSNTRCQPSAYAVALSAKQCAGLDATDNAYSYRVFSSTYNSCIVSVTSHNARTICEQIYR